MKKPVLIKENFLKNIINNVYEVNGKYGIKFEMRHNNTIKSINIPEEVKNDPEFINKLVEAINESIAMVSEQFAEEVRDNFMKEFAKMKEKGEDFDDEDFLETLDEMDEFDNEGEPETDDEEDPKEPSDDDKNPAGGN